jgi:hypothetical protein
MESENENGKQPAFAMLDPNGSYAQYGLSKREYFASLAMQGFTAGNNLSDKVTVACSIKLADELLKQLANK